ncbi:Cell cycle serine/threonine-protein kinase cdc5/MSD2 [Sorochytrium milnesiophthora]
MAAHADPQMQYSAGRRAGPTSAAATAAAPPNGLPENAQPKPAEGAAAAPNSRTDYPNPPLIMRDRKKQREFRNGGLIGKGGFARCYQVTDEQGQQLAAKVIAKSSLKNQKHRQKLLHEIKIHSSMNHAHIVQFVHYFEDPENVYLILELCDNKSLMDMVRKRKRLTEPEARYFMVQLLDAVRYMHKQNVIHRDLKLGNLFLSRDMHIKVGDFGLATSLKHDGERKKTICGTPNYIAPEILFDQQKGHSFEADIWSMGVILFTMLTGKPPFQTKEIKAIYKRIREGDYSFPQDIAIGDNAKDLIQSMLQKMPDDRPSVDKIAAHPFFTEYVPPCLPISALETAPQFRIPPSAQLVRPLPQVPQSEVSTARTYASYSTELQSTSSAPEQLLHIKPSAGRTHARKPLPDMPHFMRSQSSPEVEALQKELETVSIKPMAEAAEADEQRPSVPPKINRMFSMPVARTEAQQRDNEDGPPAPPPKTGQYVPQLARSSTVVRDGRPAEPVPVSRAIGYDGQAGSIAPVGSAMLTRSQSARARPSAIEARAEDEYPQQNHPSALAASHAAHQNGNGNYTSSVQSGYRAERNPLAASAIHPHKQSQLTASGYPGSLGRASAGVGAAESKPKAGVLELVYKNLETVFAFHSSQSLENRLALNALALSASQQQPPMVFISKWIDYSNKYGLGYQLTNGCVGVYFNDSTSIILAANDLNFEYLYYARGGERSVMRRQAHTLEDYPPELSKKVTLLKHFKGYMQENLVKASYSFSDLSRVGNLDFLTKYIRTKHAVVFRLSNHIIQVNFFDHTKLILSSEGRLVTFINKKRDILHESVVDVVVNGAHDRISRLKYARDVVEQLFNKRQSRPPAQSGADGAAFGDLGSASAGVAASLS